MEHGYTQHLATMIYSFSEKAVSHKHDLCNYWRGNSISSYVEWYLEILLHISYLFNSIPFGWKYFSFSLFSGENSSFLSFRKKEIEKRQVPLLA